MQGRSEDRSSADRVPRPHRLIRRLMWLYGSMTFGVVLLLAASALPQRVLPQFGALAHEVLLGGLGGLVLSSLLLALMALAGSLAMTASRARHAAAAAVPTAVVSSTRYGTAQRTRWSLADPGFTARVGQAFIISTGALLVWIAVKLLWPRTAVAPDATVANIAAAFVFAVAFVSLMAERVMNAFPAPQLPEAPLLRRLLLLVTVLLALAACTEIGRSVALTWIRWPELVLMWAVALIALEFALRALARLFLPPPLPADARAVADSVLVGLLTGGPRAPGNLLREHFGLDFARSWALAFLSAAILPALFGTALLCWGLTGLKLIDLSHRGIYERFGAPVAVYGPGLHLLLPWPMGRLREVEYGAIHSVAIGVDPAASTGTPSAEPLVSAEVPAPAALNRLWESAHADQAHYLVASQGTGEQGFQNVATEIYVLYRVGLSEGDALQSIYTVADPESLIREDASRLVLRYFNSRTLEQVLYSGRDDAAGTLRSELSRDIAGYRTGVEIVSVLIEEIHPPAGAAEAYHAVQAAQINANASISNERGRARRTAGVSQQEAHQLLSAATAQATETRDAADAAAYRFGVDRRAYAQSGRSFVLERLYDSLTTALRGKPLTVLDHRLSSSNGPLIDMRSGAQAAGAAAAIIQAPATTSTTPAGVPTEQEPAFTNAD